MFTFKHPYQLAPVYIKHDFWEKSHLFLLFFSEFWSLFLRIAPNISFLWSLSSFCMSLFFSACFDISKQVWILLILNNQHVMPALIIQRMVFTAGTSAGSSVLRPIVSQIEPWLSEHPLFYFLRAPAAKCSELACWALRNNWTMLTKLFQKGFWGRHTAALISILMVSVWPNCVPNTGCIRQKYYMALNMYKIM